MKKATLAAMLLTCLFAGASAWAADVKLSKDALQDIERHRAMAQAHEAAAKCLESGKSDDVCEAQLRQSCQGLAIGKFCGMKHEH